MSPNSTNISVTEEERLAILFGFSGISTHSCKISLNILDILTNHDLSDKNLQILLSRVLTSSSLLILSIKDDERRHINAASKVKQPWYGDLG